MKLKINYLNLLMYVLLLQGLLSWMTHASGFKFDILDLVVIVFCLVYVLFLQQRGIKIEKHIMWLTIYVVYAYARDYLGGYLSFGTVAGIREMWLFLFMLVVDNLSAKIGSEDKLLLTMIKITIIISTFASIMQLYNPYFMLPPSSRYLSRGSDFIHDVVRYRHSSIFGWYRGLGTGLTFLPLLALLIGSYLSSNKYKASLPYLFMGALVVFLSKTRFIYVNYLVMLSMFYVAFQRKLSKVRIFMFVVIGLVTVYGAVEFLGYLGLDTRAIVADRVFEEAKGGVLEGSGGTRILAFQVFGQMFTRSPIIGVGQNISLDLQEALEGRSGQIHVGYLSLLYYYGLVGGIFYFSFLFYLVRKLYRNAMFHSNWGPFYGTLCFVLANLTLVRLIHYDVGLLVCYAYDRVLTVRRFNTLSLSGPNESLPSANSHIMRRVG